MYNKLSLYARSGCVLYRSVSFDAGECSLIPARRRVCDVIPARLVGVFRTMYCMLVVVLVFYHMLRVLERSVSSWI